MANWLWPGLSLLSCGIIVTVHSQQDIIQQPPTIVWQMPEVVDSVTFARGDSSQVFVGLRTSGIQRCHHGQQTICDQVIDSHSSIKPLIAYADGTLLYINQFGQGLHVPHQVYAPHAYLSLTANDQTGKVYALDMYGKLLESDQNPDGFSYIFFDMKTQCGALAFESSMTGSIVAMAINQPASGTYNIALFDVDQPKNTPPLMFATGHLEWITALAFNPSGNLLAVASEDASVSIWDWRQQAQTQHLQLHSEDVTSVCWLSDQLLVSVSHDGIIIVWNALDGQLLQHVAEAHTLEINSVACSIATAEIVTGGSDQVVKKWAVLGLPGEGERHIFDDDEKGRELRTAVGVVEEGNAALPPWAQ